jgi:hypothetical protein
VGVVGEERPRRKFPAWCLQHAHRGRLRA